MTAFSMLFRGKTCPNRAQKEGPSKGPMLSVATIEVTQSHRSELNRRPLQSTNGRFERFSLWIERIIASFDAFRRNKTEKLAHQTVPKACLRRRGFAHPVTNPLVGHRFTLVSQFELEQAVRRDLDALAFRRWN